MADFDFVTSRLAVGGAVESLYDARKIEAAGITHVLNLRAGDKHPEDLTDEAPWFASLGMTYATNPTHDDGQPKDAEWFEESLEFVCEALTSCPEHKVLVHCKSGINRGPSTVYAVLLSWGLDKECAMELVTDARPEAEARYAKDAEKAIKELGYI